MRNAIRAAISLLVLVAATHIGRAIEMTWEYSVQVSATVQASPARITLSWPQDQYTMPNGYVVYRKNPADTSWGTGTSLPGSATTYVDSNVTAGTPYEYQVVKTTSQYTSYGYVYAGINVPMIDSRGKLLLVVDNTHAASLATELARLHQDLVGDGWTVIRINVNRNDSAAAVKNLIKAQYAADPANVKCVFLFGHVPVPYSGNIVPDGHAADHQGAWPADGYYGDMDGVWTDSSVNSTGQYDPRNKNVPGDGKFDQNSFPAPIKLMVGRVDLANMPGAMWTGGPATFPSELELLRNYLNKDNRYRTKQFDIPRRGIVGEFFGVRNGEAFGASGWRNFAPFFGANNVASTPNAGTWAPTLASTPYLWAYGGGAGSFGSIAGLGNSGAYNNLITTEMYTSDIKVVFTMLFGSWLGDWDASDNIMRGVLALPSYGLASVWSGRPHWFFQHMALGEPLGFGARLTMNNPAGGLYRNQVNSGAGQVHIGLMGDPTLRLHVVAPPSNVRASTNSGNVTLTWSASSDSVVGYHVYRATAADGVFTRVTTSPITALSYADATSSAGTNYMVRAVKLETSGSGTYYNPSVGVFLNPVGGTAGVSGGGSTGGGSTGGGSTGGGTTGGGTTNSTMVSWVDDALPAGAVAGAYGGDSWNWVSGNPTAQSGSRCTLSSVGSGLHDHFFYSATQTLTVNQGDVLYAYVYLDPANPPREIMLQWNNGNWEHRAYWGANLIPNGASGSASRAHMGPLPATGQWVLLQVPASQVGLEGSTLNGMAFSQFDGRAAWDNAGKASGTITEGGSSGNGGTNGGTGGTGGTTGGTNETDTATNNVSGTVSVANPLSWVDDALPSGAKPGAEGGDTWNWVNSNPAPASGNRATLSSVNTGFHQYFFWGATQGLTVNAGDLLYAYVYLDPSNTPSEVMLQWNNGSWEHRAYWGANLIPSGTMNTPGRVNMGPLPATGQWVLLTVPASAVGLEGSTINGMAFTQYGGRAGWDNAGKGTGLITNTVPGGGTNGGGNTGGGTTDTNSPSQTVTNFTAWVDDALPGGAQASAEGGDTWNWVSSGLAAPYSGNRYSLSTIASGLHQYYFMSATEKLSVAAGDVLCAAVYLDPANMPSEVMLQWNDGSWQHRAYWGADNIDYGTPGTASRLRVGSLPASGGWVLLQVPASQVGLAGSEVSGMAFSQHGGRTAWDYAGKFTVSTNSDGTTGGGTNGGGSSGGGTNGGGTTGGGTTDTNSPSQTATNYMAWVEDGLPGGAQASAEGGDSWNWVSSGLAEPYSGNRYSVSTIASGLHQYYFMSASEKLSVEAGDVLCAAVYLDPANVPSEIMLQWNDGSWQHRAYWGADNIDYGIPGTEGRVHMGPLPASGGWALLQVPASQVGLEGSELSGMAFSQYGGRAAWDHAGKFTANTNSGGSTGGGTNDGGTTGGATNVVGMDGLPGVSVVDYVMPALPKPGDHTLHVITPTLLELKMINTAPQGSSQVTSWDLVNSSGQFVAPPVSAFAVTANGSAVGVSAVGFKRRPLYAPLVYDLRVENSLYLQLSSPVSDNQTIEVRNTGGTLWASPTRFVATMDPLRYSPGVHVNQEGYMPNYQKKAMVGYYAGSMGEVNLPTTAGFKIVDASTGTQVFQGNLVQRRDVGYTYTPTPYQKVYEADFSSFNTPGEYRLVVPGMGGSLPFVIDSGVAMSFARAYALGIYHQRCGTGTSMPHTRFEHGPCHTAAASVPASASAYPFTWTTISGYATRLNQNNPPQTAPTMTSPSTALFPYVNQGPVNVSGGHHDAGDYSKYTSNSGHLIHYLMFSVDSLPGVAALDNLGIPESGDGISDVLQEAKWEADFLAKMQDADGGFYFLVYPKEREYELDVTPDRGDAQVVWPKTTSVTASSVAALAQCATSPAMKAAYPAAAAMYLQKAQLGWQFLMNAINRYGKTGAYQKITHYADNFTDKDELAWAACQMYLATKDPAIHQLLLTWFNPADPATWHWGWWHLPEGYGHAIRGYAFAVQSGRATTSQLDATFLSKCRAEVTAAANDMITFSQQHAYGSSFPHYTKAVRAAGWYFSTDQAFDLAVAYALNPQPEYLNAILANVNYEGGCNPVNVCYVTGLGWKRQRTIVSQWALNDTQVLPQTGIPVGNIGATFSYLWYYGPALEGLCFPSSGATTAPYPFYDRWGDSWNVNNEMVIMNQARSMGTLGFLAAQQTASRTQPWRAPSNATITVPSGVVPVGQSVTLSMQVPGIDLSSARITWEVRDQEPAYGETFTFAPKNNGLHRIEAEAQLPDGRRIFAKASFTVNSPNVVWVDDDVPAGGVTGADGGDSWNWVSANPAPQAGTRYHQSAVASGAHQHFFQGATSTMDVGQGDVLYAWVYLDPANPPSEIMLQWKADNWEHRAYWGANSLSYGANGTPSRKSMGALPAVGQWVQLRVPASEVGLEGSTISGMAFSAFGGRVSWDAAGRLSSASGVTSAVKVTTGSALASRTSGTPAEFIVTRDGDTNLPLTVSYTLAGAAVKGVDYQLQPLEESGTVVIPAGETAAKLRLLPLASTNFVVARDATLSLATNSAYALSDPSAATVTIGGNSIPFDLLVTSSGARLAWNGSSNRAYQVGYKDDLLEATWRPAERIVATNADCSWLDTTTVGVSNRFYLVALVD